MKALRFFLPLLFAFCLSGCFEMNEEIIVQEDGSGNLGVSMDMGQMLEMMMAFMPAEELQKNDPERFKDTTTQMKDFIDTASNISAENKALLRDGNINFKMNIKEKLLKFNVQFPFKKIDNLVKIYDNIGQASNGMGNFGIGNLLQSLPGAGGGQEGPLNVISSYFDLKAEKKSISRELNKEKYAKLLTDSTMMQLKQMGGLGGGMGEAKVNTVIKLPAAAKKITGAKAELSTDKKTVLLKNNILDIFDHPEVFEFSVEY